MPYKPPAYNAPVVENTQIRKIKAHHHDIRHERGTKSSRCFFPTPSDRPPTLDTDEVSHHTPLSATISECLPSDVFQPITAEQSVDTQTISLSISEARSPHAGETRRSVLSSLQNIVARTSRHASDPRTLLSVGACLKA